MSQIVLYFLHSTSVLSFYIGVVLTLSILQILHRDVQSKIVQSSNHIISRDRHDSNDLSAHKIPNLTCSVILRSGDWDDH